MKKDKKILENLQETILENFKKKLNVSEIEFTLGTMTINEYVLLMSRLNYQGEYLISSDGHLYFQDHSGYHAEEFTLIEDVPMMDITKYSINDMENNVRKGLLEILMYSIDFYNFSFNRPENKKYRIEYTKANIWED